MQANTDKNLLVSVIIPSYQRPVNLDFAIASVLGQSYTNIELLVVDDNPPDSEYRRQTAAVVAAYTHIPGFKYIQHEANRNGAAARNTGIAQARGEFIAFLDDDDVYYPDKIRNSLRRLQSCRLDFAAVYCGYRGWNSDSNDLDRYPEGNLALAVLCLKYSSHYMHTGSLLFKREVINKLGGFDESFARHQDLELLLRFFRHFKIAALPEVQLEIRPRPAPRNFKFDKNFLDIKIQFLTKFKTDIEAFSADESDEIYAIQFGNAVWQASRCHPREELLDYIQKFPRFYRQGLKQALLAVKQS